MTGKMPLSLSSLRLVLVVIQGVRCGEGDCKKFAVYQRKKGARSPGCGLPLMCITVQMSCVIFQRLDHKIRFLPFRDCLGNQSGNPFIPERRFLPLVWLDFLHDRLDDLGGQLAVLLEFLHLDRLCQRWCGILIFHCFQQRILLFLSQIGQLDRRTEGNAPFIDHLQNFRDK